MKKVLLSSVALLGLTAGAFAADLPSRRVAPAPYVAVPVFTWTGFYVGVNAGYGFHDNGNNGYDPYYGLGYYGYGNMPYQGRYGYNGYNGGYNNGGYNAGGRVQGITRVTQKSYGLKVYGVASSGYNGYQGYGQRGYGTYGYNAGADLSFNCEVRYDGRIRDIDINRRTADWRGY